MAVIVFADINEGKVAKNAYEAINYASKIAEGQNTSTVVVTYGDVDRGALEELGTYGAQKVLLSGIKEADSRQLGDLLAQAAEQEGAEVVVLPHDRSGQLAAPRVSVRLNAGHVPGAVALPDTSNGFVVKKNVFSGKAFAHYKINTDKKVISLLPNSHAIEKTDGKAEVTDFSADVSEADVKVKEVKKESGQISLSEADIVVSGGRGLKGPENWNIVEDLAQTLGAATACSRPVADSEWRPHHEHVGQTGRAIRPNLYIAIGISGAIQHLAGVNGSKVMVVINTDPEAPFFKAADYGIVGDAFEVVPKLTEAVKKFQAENA